MASGLTENFKNTFDLENHDWQNISIVLLMLYGFLQFLAINLRENYKLQSKSTRYAKLTVLFINVQYRFCYIERTIKD